MEKAPETQLHEYERKIWKFEDLPLHVKVALLLGWTAPEIYPGADPTVHEAWTAVTPDGEFRNLMPDWEGADLLDLLLLLKPDLLTRNHRYDSSSYWAAYANGVRTADRKGVKGGGSGNSGSKIWAVGNSPGQALCMLVLELGKYETGRKFLLELRK